MKGISFSVVINILLTKTIIFTETQKICTNLSTLTQDAQFFWLMNNESEDVIILFSNLEMCSNIVYYNTMS